MRRTKTEAKVSQRAAVDRVVVTSPGNAIAHVEHALADLREAGTIAVVDMIEHPGDSLTVSVDLAAPSPA